MTLIPDEFIHHIKQQSLSEEQLPQFIQACKTPLRKSIRVNTLKITVNEFQRIAQNYQWQLTPVPWCQEGFWIERDAAQEKAAPLGNYPEHLQGLFYIQEASSMLPVEALLSNSDTPDLLLDMAAAPGSKTTQLAARLSNAGTLIANELSSSRIKGLHSNIQRCGVSNVCLTHYDGRVFGERMEQIFNAILLDAPCGGEGTVRKDPDAMKNWSLQALQDISQIQKALIESAYKALKPGGTLVYSTCTLSREENQDVCQHLLDTFPEMQTIPLNDLFDGANQCATEEGFLHVFPHIYDSEGFFVAAFKKAPVASPQEKAKPPKRWPFDRPSKKTQQELVLYLQKQFEFDLRKSQKELYQRDNELWLFPEATVQVAAKLKVDRAGVKLGDMHKSQLRTHHDFAIAFGSQFQKNCIELDRDQLQSYLQGRDIELSSSQLSQIISNKGEYLLCFSKQPLGLGKRVANKIKNNLPRALVRDNPVVTE